MALRIAVLCVSAALIVTGIRTVKPEIALAVALAAGVAACMMAIDEIKALAGMLDTLSKEAGFEENDISIVLKATGISLAGEYAAQICRDTGEGALAQRIDTAIRITIIALGAPFIYEVLDMIRSFSV